MGGAHMGGMGGAHMSGRAGGMYSGGANAACCGAAAGCGNTGCGACDQEDASLSYVVGSLWTCTGQALSSACSEQYQGTILENKLLTKNSAPKEVLFTVAEHK